MLPGDVPTHLWNLAAGLGVVLVVSFLVSGWGVWREERGRKGGVGNGGGPREGRGGGVSYA